MTTKSILITTLTIALTILSCKKEKPEPESKSNTNNSTNPATNYSCEVAPLMGKLYCEVPDTTGLTGSSTAIFRIVDTTKASLIYSCGGAISNPNANKYYQVKYYGWMQNTFQELGQTYYRATYDCHLYVPVVNGTRCNYFDMSTTAWNQGAVSNHIQFKNMGDSIWVIDMHGGAVSGNKDVYARDSMKFYLIN